MAHVTLAEKLTAAVRKAVKAEGGPVTLAAILKAAKPTTGYVREYRDAALKVTKIVAYTPHGYPLHVLATDPGYLPAAVCAAAVAETASWKPTIKGERR